MSILSLLALIGCAQEYINTNADTAAPETAAPSTAIDDTATNEEPKTHEVYVSYLPPTDADQDYWLDAGEENVVGTITMVSPDNGLYVTSLGLDLYVSIDAENVEDSYGLGQEGELVGSDYMLTCRLVDATNPNRVIGVADPFADGTIDFTDEFPLGGEFGTMLTIVCAVSDLRPHGTVDGFALDIDASRMSGYSTADSGQISATVVANNGGKNPKSAGLLVYME